MPPSPKIIAHRGASFDAPENTALAARLAWEQEADMVECDIRLTKDQKIVALHDDSLRRTTGIHRLVGELTLPELQKLDAGRFKHAQFLGEKIPTLNDLIATMPDGKGLVIEIKDGPEILPALQQVLSASHKPPGQFAIISFHDEVLQAAREVFPQCPLLWVVKKAPKNYQLADLVRYCREARFDGLDLHYSWLRDEDSVRQVRDQGLLLYTWTVDEPVIARRLAEAGIDGITTNRPGWLRKALK